MHTLELVIKALQSSWDSQSSSAGDRLPLDNLARGQCMASSLVIQHYFGGELVRVHANGDGIDENHYYNQLPDGTILDTTCKQYRVAVTMTPNPVNFIGKGFSSIRLLRLSDTDIKQQYEHLLHNVEKYLKESTHANI